MRKARSSLAYFRQSSAVLMNVPEDEFPLVSGIMPGRPDDRAGGAARVAADLADA